MSELVEAERIGVDDSIGVVRLVREKPLNSLLLATIDEISAHILPWLEDDSIACILIDSSSERAFCAGADITALYHAIREGDLAYPDAFFSREYRLDYALHTAEKPVIAWGHGIVMGGGLGLLGGCSHRIGTPSTVIAMPEITIGLFPDAGGSWFLSRLPEGLGLFAGLTGCQLGAGDALELGLLDHVVDAGSKARIISSLEATEWEIDPVLNIKRVTDVMTACPTPDALSFNMTPHREAIRELMTACAVADDFLDRFESGLQAIAGNSWLQQALATYRAGSPTTARIFLEQMRRVEGMSLAEMFRLELIIASQCARHHDFPEGVRALLIDKDRTPVWQYSDAGEIPDAYLAGFFQPAWEGEHPLADLV